MAPPERLNQALAQQRLEWRANHRQWRGKPVQGKKKQVHITCEASNKSTARRRRLSAGDVSDHTTQDNTQSQRSVASPPESALGTSLLGGEWWCVTTGVSLEKSAVILPRLVGKVGKMTPGLSHSEDGRNQRRSPDQFLTGGQVHSCCKVQGSGIDPSRAWLIL